MHAVSPRVSPRKLFLPATVFAALALFALAGRAEAAETLYWDNYDGRSISFASPDGSGGGSLSAATPVVAPEGMAIDTGTGRLYVASAGNTEESIPGQIRYFNLDGSGGGTFTAPGAPINIPLGVAIDPVSRTIYWVNVVDAVSTTDQIVWAKLDGSAGGVLNTAGATLDGAFRLALDLSGGRIFWGNGSGAATPSISYAYLNNSGGGNLPTSGATPPKDVSGLAIDNVANRVYWVDRVGENVSYASLGGDGGGELGLTGASFDEGYGLALDPLTNRVLWGNYDNGESRTGAIGFASLAGGGGGIDISSAPVDGPQDPVILRGPSGTGVPAVTRAKNNRSTLTCSAGAWAADFAGSYVYQAPTTYAYQWLRNGKAVAASAAATLTAKSAGKYACTVTAANHAGSAAQTSAVVKVEASKAKLATKKRVTVKAGGIATFTVKVANQGDLKSKNAKLCVTLPRSARGALKAPRCRALGKLKGRGKKSAKLKIKTLPSASGVYSVAFKVKGIAGKAAKAKVVVK